MLRSLNHYCALLLLLLVLQACAVAQEESSALPKAARPVRWSRVEGSVEAILQIDKTRHLLQFQVASAERGPAPELTMAQRIKLWEPLLKRAMRKYGDKVQYLAAVGDYPELGSRLAAAAASSGEWDLSAGKPRDGDANTFVRHLLRRERLFPELDAFFGACQYQVSVQSVESVVLCRGDEIHRELPEAGAALKVSAASLVPCGGSILFRLNPKQRVQ